MKSKFLDFDAPALAGFHVGLRWGAARAALRRILKERRPERRRPPPGSGFGGGRRPLWAFVDRDMARKLFFGYSFDYWDSGRPPWLLSAENPAIPCLYAIAARGLRTVPTRFRGRRVPPRPRRRRSLSDDSRPGGGPAAVGPAPVAASPMAWPALEERRKPVGPPR